jgi:hypothetical protein
MKLLDFSGSRFEWVNERYGLSPLTLEAQTYNLKPPTYDLRRSAETAAYYSE